MASLNGQTIASSYEQLLHVDRDGGGNSTTLVDVKDGDNGTTFALKLATDKIQVNGSSDLDGAVTINESSADADFRVESNGNTHMLFVDASENNVGIGTSTPDTNSDLNIEGSGYKTLLVNTTAVGGGGLIAEHNGTQSAVYGTGGSTWLSGSATTDALIRAEQNLIIASGGNTRAVTIDSSQRVGIGVT